MKLLISVTIIYMVINSNKTLLWYVHVAVKGPEYERLPLLWGGGGVKADFDTDNHMHTWAFDMDFNEFNT